LCLASCLIALGAAQSASGAAQLFSGWDNNAGVGSALPVSDAAMNSFLLAAPVAMSPFRFDDLATGFASNYILDPVLGVTLTLSAGFIQGYGAGVTADTTQPQYGFNTSPAGGQFLRVYADGNQPGGGVALFQFSRPQRSFGFYVTGIYGDASSPLTVELNDGTPRSFTVPDMPASTAQFWGVVTDGDFTSVSLRLNYPGGGYLMGLDDVYLQETPEPPTIFLGLAGFLLLIGWRSNGKRPAPSGARQPPLSLL
jgi:hypothetical protein